MCKAVEFYASKELKLSSSGISMMCRFLPINEHISCSTRQCCSHAVQFSGKLHLAAKTAGICQRESHVEHVIFVVVRFGDEVIVL